VRDAKKNETNPCLELTIEDLCISPRKKRGCTYKEWQFTNLHQKNVVLTCFNQAKWDEVAT
jgi:hypothetical protein